MTKSLNTNDALTIVVLSDIHLGHRKNKAKDMVVGLKNMFSDREETAKIDLIVLAGDVFDRLLNLAEDDVTDIMLWISWLLELCARNNIVLRVLEGTPSHEWFQSGLFESVLKVTKTPVNFEYVKTLSIEHIEPLGIDVLYVPDEWDTSTDKTLEQVKELLRLKELDKVDYAFMHGNFHYQLPNHIKKAPRHNEEEYLNIVKHYIFIGHIHTHSNYKRIIAQGSFDRISHGEEEPKGHVRSIVSSRSSQWFFVENKNAKIYLTVNCKDMDLDKTLERIWKKVKLLPPQSHVRIKAQSNHSIMQNMNELIAAYPLLVWTKISTKEEETPVESNEVILHDSITINKENIVSLIMDRVNKTSSNTELNKLSHTLLLEVI